MATPALIVVVAVAVLTLVALGVAVLFLLTNVKRLTRSVGELQARLQPTLEVLSQEAEGAQRELEQVTERAQALQRRQRRQRR